MNDQKQVSEVPPEPKSRAELREEQREERREGKSGGAWIWGVVLILMGALFLFQNIGKFNFPFYNWWALFILIPALGALSDAYRKYRESGNQVTRSVRNSLFGGIILLIVTVTLLFNLSWTYLGPALIILVGLGLLLGGTVFKD